MRRTAATVLALPLSLVAAVLVLAEWAYVVTRRRLRAVLAGRDMIRR